MGGDTPKPPWSSLHSDPSSSMLQQYARVRPSHGSGRKQSASVKVAQDLSMIGPDCRSGVNTLLQKFYIYFKSCNISFQFT